MRTIWIYPWHNIINTRIQEFGDLFIYAIFSFLRMGTTGFTAQAYGANDERESGLILARSMGVAFAGALLMLLIQVPIDWFTFLVIEADISWG